MKIVNMDVLAGTSINVAAADALDIIRILEVEDVECFVEFKFNGQKMVVKKGDKVAEIADKYMKSLDEASEAHKNSPKGKAEAKRWAAELLYDQKKYDHLVSKLSGINLKNPEAAVRWLAQFAGVADNVNIKKVSTEKILRHFELAGYRASMNATRKGEASIVWQRRNSRPRQLQWLVRQGMSSIKMLGSPHPMLMTFAERMKVMKSGKKLKLITKN